MGEEELGLEKVEKSLDKVEKDLKEMERALEDLTAAHVMVVEHLKDSMEKDASWTKKWILISAIFTAGFAVMKVLIPGASDRLLFAIGLYAGVILGLMGWHFSSRAYLKFLKRVKRAQDEILLQ